MLCLFMWIELSNCGEKSCMFLGACAMRTHNNSSQALYQPLILKYGVAVSSDQDRNCQVQKMTF